MLTCYSILLTSVPICAKINPDKGGKSMNTHIFQGSTVRSERILHTPSDFARANLLHLQETGTLTALERHKSQRDNLSSYLFFIVTDGSGTLEYNGTEHLISKGDCVFLDCRRPYAHCTSENLWSLKWVHFYGPNMSGIYEKYVERGGLPCFAPSELSVYEQTLDRIKDIAENDGYLKDMHIFEQLTSLLTRLMEESWNPEVKVESSAKRNNLQEIKDYIDLNFSQKITLDMLSERFFINKFYLTRIFKEQFGTSVNSYLTQVRITRAKQLLRFSDSSVEQVGLACGFSDNNYFSRIFRKVEGCTPKEFRKRW